MHSPKRFEFKDETGQKFGYITFKYTFFIDEIIGRAEKEHNLGDFAETDLPYLLKGFHPDDVPWNDENLNVAADVLNYFLRLRAECAAEAELIRKRNPCFSHKDPDSDFRFDPSKYLSQEELEYYPIHLLSGEDPQAFDAMLKDHCLCEFTFFQALALTGQIREAEYHHYIKKQMENK